MTGLATKENDEVVAAREEMREAQSVQHRDSRTLRRQTLKAAGQPHRTISLPPVLDVDLQVHFPRLGVWRCMKKLTCQACRFGTCKTSVDPERRSNQCDCHRGKRCRVWDTSHPCTTPFEEVPPTERARAGNQARAPSASTVGTVDAEVLTESVARLQNSTLELSERIKHLVARIEEQEREREVTVQHIEGLKVSELIGWRNEVLENMDEAVELAREQIGLLQVAEDQCLDEEDGATDPEQQTEGDVFLQTPEEVNRQHHLAGQGAGRGIITIPNQLSEQELEARAADLRLLDSLKARERTPSKITLGGGISHTAVQPSSAPPVLLDVGGTSGRQGAPGAAWAGFGNLSPWSRERFLLQSQAKNSLTAPPDPMQVEERQQTVTGGQEERASSVQVEERQQTADSGQELPTHRVQGDPEQASLTDPVPPALSQVEERLRTAGSGQEQQTHRVQEVPKLTGARPKVGPGGGIQEMQEVQEVQKVALPEGQSQQTTLDPRLQHWRAGLQEMTNDVHQRFQAVEGAVAEMEMAGQAPSSWVRHKLGEIEELEARCSVLGKAAEDYGKQQVTMPPEVFAEAGTPRPYSRQHQSSSCG